MNNKKDLHSKNKPEKVKEPSISFKNFKAFNSIEEMEQDELKWLAGLAPEEHLQYTTSLIKRVFSEQLEKHPKIGTQIHFSKPQ